MCDLLTAFYQGTQLHFFPKIDKNVRELTIREFFQYIDDVTLVKRELVWLLSGVVVKSVHLRTVYKEIQLKGSK